MHSSAFDPVQIRNWCIVLSFGSPRNQLFSTDAFFGCTIPNTLFELIWNQWSATLMHFFELSNQCYTPLMHRIFPLQFDFHMVSFLETTSKSLGFRAFFHVHQIPVRHWIFQWEFFIIRAYAANLARILIVKTFLTSYSHLLLCFRTPKTDGAV
jgi:hypothetical protein